MKICKTCSINKDKSQFALAKKAKDLCASSCKECCNKYAKEYRKKNKTKRHVDQLEYREKNKDILLLKSKEYYIKNRDIILNRNKLYRDENKDYLSKRRTFDVNFKISGNLRSRLYQAVKNNYKSGSAVDDLGCSIEEFKKYLESKFESWMTWDNYGLYDINRKTWHLDHINALVNFDLSNREELLKACHYTNIQPMLAKDNLTKGSK